jgi:hypothetical protein
MRQVVSDPAVTVEVCGEMLLESLEAGGASRSHIATVESHLRAHLVVRTVRTRRGTLVGT